MVMGILCTFIALHFPSFFWAVPYDTSSSDVSLLEPRLSVVILLKPGERIFDLDAIKQNDHGAISERIHVGPSATHNDKL